MINFDPAHNSTRAVERQTTAVQEASRDRHGADKQKEFRVRRLAALALIVAVGIGSGAVYKILGNSGDTILPVKIHDGETVSGISEKILKQTGHPDPSTELINKGVNSIIETNPETVSSTGTADADTTIRVDTDKSPFSDN